MQLPNSITLPSALAEQETKVFANLTALCELTFEPVGRWFDVYAQRRRQKHTLSYHSIKSSSSEEEEEEEEEEDDAADGELLLTLDPKDWKNQDHYAVLGLGKKRLDATEHDIKKAYKKKVLHHHPDKRKARGLPVKEGDDDYFTCITRAWEVLGVPSKRRSYDSVDPLFDDSVPAPVDSPEEFYTTFAPVFERNARWSTKRRKIPLLGNDDSTYEEVNHFYSFWYEFDSWREYSYLDEEEKEKGENRDERRWIEKQNKAERQKRKKEEIARIRMLVDNAYNSDPRIPRFKEQEKAKKLAQKQAKKDAARAKAEEEQRRQNEILEAEQKKREEEEEKAKAAAAAVKKEKEAQKKALKKERKTLRTKVKDFNYFSEEGHPDRVAHMTELDRLAESLSLLRLQALNESLAKGDKASAKQAFLDSVKQLREELDRQSKEQLEASQKGSGGASGGAGKSKNPWSEDELTLLIKGVNVYPAGTVSRWETISGFITQHLPSSNRSEKEVLFKVKELQRMDPNMKQEVNQKAYEKFDKLVKPATTVDKAEISQRTETAAEQQVYELGSNPAPWSKEEQTLLEKALRTFPASTPQRWDKIAEQLPNRSKKDCMKRYKELVEMVQAKKAAALAAKKK